MSKTNLLISSVAAIAILIGINAVTASAGVVTFSDTNLSNADWTHAMMYKTGLGGSFDATDQLTTGGCSGSSPECRQIQQSVKAHNGQWASCYWEFYQYGNGTTTGVFDPTVEGQILNVDFSQWWNITNRGTPNGFAVGAALKQNGVIYLSLLDNTKESGWTQKIHTGLTALNFRTLLDANAHPDFSATGAPIIVGFYVGNSGTKYSTAFTDAGNIDDWSISFTTPTNAPEPAAMTLLVLGGLALVNRRRSQKR
jgi:hypothetical protein